MAQAIPADAQTNNGEGAMDLGTVLNVFFAVMVVPCVALLVYGAWLAWGEAAHHEDREHAARLYRTARVANRAAAIPARPSGEQLWNRPSTRQAT